MCYKVIINSGEKEIDTPRQFLEHFGFKAKMHEKYNVVGMDGCLCPVDVGKTLKQHKIPFKQNGMDFYVGADWADCKSIKTDKQKILEDLQHFMDAETFINRRQ